MDILFALKALAYIIGYAFATVVGSFISAIWLRLAAQWLGFVNIPYFNAFKSALISNFVVLTFNFSTGVNYGLSVGLLRQMSSQDSSRSFDLTYAYSPIYFLYATISAVLVTAVIFCRTLPDKESGSRFTFSDSIALTSFYFTLAFAFATVLALLALCVVAALLTLIGM